MTFAGGPPQVTGRPPVTWRAHLDAFLALIEAGERALGDSDTPPGEAAPPRTTTAATARASPDRERPVAAPTADELAELGALQERAAELLRQMTRARDEIAAELGTLARQRQAGRAYAEAEIGRR